MSGEFDEGHQRGLIQGQTLSTPRGTVSTITLSTPKAHSERRRDPSEPLPTFGELLSEFWWPPEDRPPQDPLPYLIANGYAEDRRKR
jgi:hypothetical protein